MFHLDIAELFLPVDALLTFALIPKSVCVLQGEILNLHIQLLKGKIEIEEKSRKVIVWTENI